MRNLVNVYHCISKLLRNFFVRQNMYVYTYKKIVDKCLDCLYTKSFVMYVKLILYISLENLLLKGYKS